MDVEDYRRTSQQVREAMEPGQERWRAQLASKSSTRRFVPARRSLNGCHTLLVIRHREEATGAEPM